MKGGGMDKVLAKIYIRKEGRLFRWRDVYIRKNKNLLPLHRGVYGIRHNGILYVSGCGKLIKPIRRFNRTFDKTFG